MVFSSTAFLFAFLPCALALYYVIPGKPAKNVVLLLASLVFYSWGEPRYVMLMVVSIVINWAFGLWMGYADDRLNRRQERSEAEDPTGPLVMPSDRKARRNPVSKVVLLVACLALNLGLLAFFKYEGFFADNINWLAGELMFPDLELILPIGISFYTLQAISYVVDVYRGRVEAQMNILYLGMYIAMFPQLIAGPIVRYADIAEQIRHRTHSLAKFCGGFRLFAIGLAKKVLLANTVALLAESMLSLGGASIGAFGAWFGLIAFTFQIYFDFGGYSDMAIGLGRMFGFEYKRNFNYPYISRSITEFWRRWHISLSTFFRDYVYIPLGGNRVGKARWVLNVMVVWGLTGFWHGAAWNYLLWGLYYGIMLLNEKLWLGRLLDKAPSILGHAWAIIAFLFGWLIFWIEDPQVFGEYIGALFGAYGVTGSSTLWELQAWSYLSVFVVCAFACTPLVPWLRSLLMRWAIGREEKKVRSAAHARVVSDDGPSGRSGASARADFSREEVEAQDGIAATDDLVSTKRLDSGSQCNFELWYQDLEAANAPASRKAVVQIVQVLADVACLALVVLSAVSVISGSFNPFIYFRF